MIRFGIVVLLLAAIGCGTAEPPRTFRHAGNPPRAVTCPEAYQADLAMSPTDALSIWTAGTAASEYIYGLTQYHAVKRENTNVVVSAFMEFTFSDDGQPDPDKVYAVDFVPEDWGTRLRVYACRQWTDAILSEVMAFYQLPAPSGTS